MAVMGVEDVRLGLNASSKIDRQPNWLKHEEKAAEVCLKEKGSRSLPEAGQE